MPWQLYLVKFKTALGRPHDTAKYASLEHGVYEDGRILHVFSLLRPGYSYLKNLYKNTDLSISVEQDSYTLYLTRCQEYPQESSFLILPPDGSYPLGQWCDEGFETIKFRAHLRSGRFTESSVIIYIHRNNTNYRLCWWNTDLGPLPEALPESS